MVFPAFATAVCRSCLARKVADMPAMPAPEASRAGTPLPGKAFLTRGARPACRSSSYQDRRRRYSMGVMPVARWKARVKLACEENWALSAISTNVNLPAANSVFAFSNLFWLM